ncbi:PIN domain-containing protein [candidate division TA06 bacterium]|uniref:PIN domain-containing protein n=1 Tax=candidate division TA06 bacterium TaxID=2250710 RepID=A0A523UYC4_UNCT6|nr:MAG: PIN domain-containing protein [candidate division TA06 bacterium]
MEGVVQILTEIHKNKAKLITSALTKAEILRSTLPQGAEQKLGGALRRRNCIVAETDDRVWRLAHEIRDFYERLKAKNGLPTVTLPDAVHLATAILYEADEFHTFDENDKPGKRRALIPLSGNVADKYSLVICKPIASQMDVFEGTKT